MSDDHGGGHDDHGHGSDAERQFYVKVDRTPAPKPAPHGGHGTSPPPPPPAPLVDYMRLGSPSDDARFDKHKSVEKEAKDKFLELESLKKIEHHLGAAGSFMYTSGSHTGVIAGDSFERVAGEVYRVYKEKHEVCEDALVVSGEMHNPLGWGLEYKVSRAMEYEASMDAKLEFSAGAEYSSKASAAIEAKTGIALGIALGAEVEVAHQTKAEFNITGEFEASASGLTHGETPIYFGEESITLGLSDDPVHGALKKAFIGLAGLLQAGDLAYAGFGTVAALRVEELKKKPSDVEVHVNAAQIIATAQGALALVACVLSLIAMRKQKASAKELAAGNVGHKPFLRIDEHGHSNRIVLDTGAGASITMAGNAVTISATNIALRTDLAQAPGDISVLSGNDLYLYGQHDALMGATNRATVQGDGGVRINAPGNDIISTANKWTQNGAFQAGQTTLGATNATSLNVNNQPVATTAAVAQVQTLLDQTENTLARRINVLDAQVANLFDPDAMVMASLFD